jgi:hypothetical protein
MIHPVSEATFYSRLTKLLIGLQTSHSFHTDIQVMLCTGGNLTTQGDGVLLLKQRLFGTGRNFYLSVRALFEELKGFKHSTFWS